MVKIEVNDNLLSEAKKRYPETQGLNWTQLAEFLIRKALKEAS